MAEDELGARASFCLREGVKVKCLRYFCRASREENFYPYYCLRTPQIIFILPSPQIENRNESK